MFCSILFRHVSPRPVDLIMTFSLIFEDGETATGCFKIQKSCATFSAATTRKTRS